jgi:hypothetical protein
MCTISNRFAESNVHQQLEGDELGKSERIEQKPQFSPQNPQIRRSLTLGIRDLRGCHRAWHELAARGRRPDP